MKASAILKENIRIFMKIRGINARQLARAVRQTYDPKVDSWMSKMLKNPTREIPLKYLDKIASELGVTVYQLFQPGHSSVSERRSGFPRRSGRDRRIAHIGVTEKRGDIDFVDIIRALSNEGRGKVLAYAADVWNDELEALRSRAGLPDVPDRKPGTHGPTSVHGKKRQAKTRGATDADRT